MTNEKRLSRRFAALDYRIDTTACGWLRNLCIQKRDDLLEKTKSMPIKKLGEQK